ncbi:MAG: divalent-cation tolerance protein CutA [Nevskiaceae bacterium]|nr:MAG: divalent-cation tolerance protein CutA [Nevskiaceae bacterium]TBR73029.1 MAG: divalent-cation tolerance protein CutA [Nevskiaceae bacterium]
MTETHALIVYGTCPERHAETLARVLVDARLAACVNIVPGVKSVFRWAGRVQQETESLLVIKTTQARYAELEKAWRDRHPYELPELMAVPVAAGLPDYLSWLETSTL